MSEEKKEMAQGIGPPLRPTGVKMPDDPIVVGRRKYAQRQQRGGFWKRTESESKPEPKPQTKTQQVVKPSGKVEKRDVKINNNNYYSDRTEPSWFEENKDLAWWGGIIGVGIILYILIAMAMGGAFSMPPTPGL